jgi:hypothetical protein
MTGMRIDEGHFGDVSLAGLTWCGLFAWPGPIHEGQGEALVVISKGLAAGAAMLLGLI